MLITNNEDFYQYMTNRGVVGMYSPKPNKAYKDDLCVIFTNKYHSLAVCGNAHQNKYKDEYEREASELLDWFECGNKVIMISNIIKLGTPYMRDNYKLLQQKYDKLKIKKQVFNTKEIGELINPHRVQIRYKGVIPIMFDFEGLNDNIQDPKYVWTDDNGNYKQQQIHYLNVINATPDRDTRRKLRYLPEYALYSQLYKKLYL